MFLAFPPKRVKRAQRDTIMVSKLESTHQEEQNEVGYEGGKLELV